MYPVRNAFTNHVHLGSIGFEIIGVEEIITIALDEELQRLICSVSSRPDRNGL